MKGCLIVIKVLANAVVDSRMALDDQAAVCVMKFLMVKRGIEVTIEMTSHLFVCLIVQCNHPTMVGF